MKQTLSDVIRDALAEARHQGVIASSSLTASSIDQRLLAIVVTDLESALLRALAAEGIVEI